MSTLKDTKLMSGRTVSFGGSVDIFKTDAGGIGLDPVFYEGSFTYHNGEMYFSNGLEWVTTDPPIIRTPSSLTPTSTIQSRQLRLSPFSTTLSGEGKPVQAGVIYEISLNRDMTNSIVFTAVTTNGNTYNLSTQQQIGTSIIVPGTTFYWRGKYIANYGGGQIESSFSKSREQVFPDFIDKPSILTIKDIVTETVTIGTFGTPFSTEANSTTVSGITIPSLGYLGVINKVFSEWEAYSTDNLDILTIPGSTDYNSTYRYNQPYLTTTTNISTLVAFADLPPASDYYWRARYTGQDNGINNIPGKGYITGPWTALQKQKQVEAIVTPRTIPDPWIADQLITSLQITPYDSAQTPKVNVQETVWEIYSSTNTANIRYKYTTNGTSSIFTSNFIKNNSPFGDIKLDVETKYYWRARYINANGAQSEYTSNIPVSFLIPNDINTPTIVTPLLSNTATLEISAFKSVAEPQKFYNSTEWEIYSSDIAGNINLNDRVYTATTSNIQKQNTSNILTGEPALVAGARYYWRARYVGVESNTIIPKYYSFWTSYGTFVQEYNIIKPSILSYSDSTEVTVTITDLAAKVTVLGPSVTFNSSNFSVKSKIEYHYSTIWDIQVQDATNTNNWIQNWDSNPNPTDAPLTSWTSNKIDEDSVYRIRVMYIGTTKSEWSDYFYFKTVGQYVNAIPDPTFYNKDTGVNSLVIGQFSNGGYYSGDMWNYVCETAPRIINIPAQGNILSDTTGYKNNIYLPIQGSTTFTTRKNILVGNSSLSIAADSRYHITFEITDDLNNTIRQNLSDNKGNSNALFYIGQVVDVRNKNNPYEKMQGHIVKAYGTKITVGVYKSEIGELVAGERTGISSSVKWCIMSRYSIFISDASRVGAAVTAVNNSFFEGSGIGYTINSLPPAIPYEAFSYTEGYRATQAYSATFKTPNVPANVAGTIWSYLSSLNTAGNYNNAGYTDWYIPSRDEIALVAYYYASNTNVSHFTSAATLYKRTSGTYPINKSAYSRISLKYTMYGAFPDTDYDWIGYNKNSVTPQNEFNWDRLDASTKLQYPLLSTLPANPDYNATAASQKIDSSSSYIASSTFVKASRSDSVGSTSVYSPLTYTPGVNKYEYDNAVVPYVSTTVTTKYGDKADAAINIKVGLTTAPLSFETKDATQALYIRPIRRQIY
jgi:hypothetical protein